MIYLEPTKTHNITISRNTLELMRRRLKFDPNLTVKKQGEQISEALQAAFPSMLSDMIIDCNLKIGKMIVMPELGDPIYKSEGRDKKCIGHTNGEYAHAFFARVLQYLMHRNINLLGLNHGCTIFILGDKIISVCNEYTENIDNNARDFVYAMSRFFDDITKDFNNAI